ncbi:LDLR chaperone boca-like [Contarinia nasturtii]|uniref:LDLR chaperone boca-like n=1 Tax=Contarinia nasturtii TaxID=265458 RepID=UPI0012D416BE|nr:LDLR chaperone boca-like [Contarinia nasturtii]XP_031641206.1 LDLR chaperone boca-like [Contarinia nasturtii]
MITSNRRFQLIAMLVVCLIIAVSAEKNDDNEKPAWAKKKISDYSDVDMERLLDQWNEDDDDGDPDDDVPEHLRPTPQIDLSSIDTSNPENLLKELKKGRTVMTFVAVSENPSRIETEEITKVWQTSLWNANIQAEKYMIDDNRAIFIFKDGSQAWKAKDYLIGQERCESVSVENKVYPGKGSPNGGKDEL